MISLDEHSVWWAVGALVVVVCVDAWCHLRSGDDGGDDPPTTTPAPPNNKV